VSGAFVAVARDSGAVIDFDVENSRSEDRVENDRSRGVQVRVRNEFADQKCGDGNEVGAAFACEIVSEVASRRRRCRRQCRVWLAQFMRHGRFLTVAGNPELLLIPRWTGKRNSGSV